MTSSLARLLLLVSLLFSVPLQAQGGAVTAADPRAAEAGREMLRAGGTAADAALAMMLALSVVEPQSSGIGGGSFIVYHDAKSGQAATIDGRETAPAATKPDRFLDAGGKPLGFREAVVGGRSVGIPGNIALAAKAHGRWGKLKWRRLFDPAIRLAEEGYTVTPRLASVIRQMSPAWEGLDATRAVYFKDGQPIGAGETFRNPAKARLLREIARRGPRAFYAGANARAIADAVSKSPKGAVPLSASEIGRYKAKDRAPVCFAYRVYKLCGMGPPSSGATTVFQILGMLERFDLKALGKDSPTSWHLIAEAMMLAYADREQYLGDPDFVDVPVAGLLDKGYIAQRSALIGERTSLAKYEAGTPPGAKPRAPALSGETGGTTHFIAVDKWGNIASMTSTIEGPFGSQLVANGMSLNNELTDFSWVPVKNGAPIANRPQAGKRPLSSMSPTIVYDAAGKPVFAVGAAGGKRIIMQVTKTLIAHLDWELSAKDALAAPNIYFGGEAVLIEQGTALEAMMKEIAGLGRTVVTSPLAPSKANAMELTSAGWRGAADPRSDGAALEE